jgi:hypothetical protein
MPISLKDEIIKFNTIEHEMNKDIPISTRKMIYFYNNLLNFTNTLKLETCFISNNYKYFKNNEFYASFMIEEDKFINCTEANIHNVVREIILYNKHPDIIEYLTNDNKNIDKENIKSAEIKKFLINSKRVNTTYYEDVVKIENETFIFRMKPELILEKGYREENDVSFLPFVSCDETILSKIKKHHGTIYKIQIIKKGNEPKPKKPKNKKNKLSPKIEIIEEPIIITDDEATHEEPFIMTDDEITHEEPFIITDDEITHEEPFIITDDEITHEEPFIINDDKSDDISLLSDITDDIFILNEDTKELNKIIDITFNKRQIINNNEQIYIKEILLNLIESNKKFQNIIIGYDTITILRGIHHDKNLLDISKHFNGYLFNTLNNKRSNTFHFYIYNDKVSNITELNNII